MPYALTKAAATPAPAQQPSPPVPQASNIDEPDSDPTSCLKVMLDTLRADRFDRNGMDAVERVL